MFPKIKAVLLLYRTALYGKAQKSAIAKYLRYSGIQFFWGQGTPFLLRRFLSKNTPIPDVLYGNWLLIK